MDRAEALDRLQQFEVQTQRLLNKSFVRDLMANPGTFTIRSHKLEDGSWVFMSDVTPQEEDPFESFLLVLRQFYGPNDAFALRKIRPVYQSGLLPAHIADHYLALAASLDRTLDFPLEVVQLDVGPLPQRVFTDDPGMFFMKHFQNVSGRPAPPGGPTFRDVFEAFLFGVYAHAGAKYQQKLTSWLRSPFYGYYQNTFRQTLCDFVDFLRRMRDVNKSAIEALKTPAEAGPTL